MTNKSWAEWKEWAKRLLSRFAEACVWAGRYAAYPVHALLRIGARLCSLLATVASILSVALFVAALYCIAQVIGISTWRDIHQFLASTFGNAGLLQFAALFVSLGIAGTLLKLLGCAAWAQAKYLWNLLGEVRKGNWLPRFKSEGSQFPDLKVVDSLRTTWDKYIVTIPCTVRNSLRSSLSLMLVLLGIAAVFGAVWLGQNKPASQDGHHVIVTGAHEAKPETLRVYLRQGSVFSVMYMDNAKLTKPDSGLGICLDGENRKWLEVFSGAVRGCIAEATEQELACESGEKPCPVLKVTGFASVAPEQVAPEQNDERNDCPEDVAKTFNCKVANLRARAVGAFLADDGKKSHWECPDDNGNFDGATKCPAELCDGEEQPLRMTENGRSIGIVVEQWASECEMLKGKPANDGEVPDPRRYRVEVLNRAVHIEVLEDFCALPQSAA